jgi:hypothetical protein
MLAALFLGLMCRWRLGAFKIPISAARGLQDQIEFAGIQPCATYSNCNLRTTYKLQQVSSSFSQRYQMYVWFRKNK